MILNTKVRGSCPFPPQSIALRSQSVSRTKRHQSLHTLINAWPMMDRTMPELFLHNSLTRRKERVEPADPANGRIYLCGPTVYDLAHLGNARPVVVYDVVARLLRRLYPHATYVRNITDVDDKINTRAQD